MRSALRIIAPSARPFTEATTNHGTRTLKTRRIISLLHIQFTSATAINEKIPQSKSSPLDVILYISEIRPIFSLRQGRRFRWSSGAYYQGVAIFIWISRGRCGLQLEECAGEAKHPLKIKVMLDFRQIELRCHEHTLLISEGDTQGSGSI